MARTYRAEPSHQSYLRRPKHMRAKREILRSEDEGVIKNRKPIPPSDWDDQLVSVYRGQEWNRR